ncbi:hypothetical protein Bpfe_002010 [Biomphalaria pfeifferi]|uniref:Uncharacterized protein n=1 Tax=Biomphalaria pfeifferi TaxID=112525 RepID=A0AAD8FKW6_BIOPF|nr:hypothetical protein Bpfe_002010 [Biomphalaria pfeifferi]
MSSKKSCAKNGFPGIALQEQINGPSFRAIYTLVDNASLRLNIGTKTSQGKINCVQMNRAEHKALICRTQFCGRTLFSRGYFPCQGSRVRDAANVYNPKLNKGELESKHLPTMQQRLPYTKH